MNLANKAMAHNDIFESAKYYNKKVLPEYGMFIIRGSNTGKHSFQIGLDQSMRDLSTNDLRAMGEYLIETASKIDDDYQLSGKTNPDNFTRVTVVVKVGDCPLYNLLSVKKSNFHPSLIGDYIKTKLDHGKEIQVIIENIR